MPTAAVKAAAMETAATETAAKPMVEMVVEADAKTDPDAHRVAVPIVVVARIAVRSVGIAGSIGPVILIVPGGVGLTVLGVVGVVAVDIGWNLGPRRSGNSAEA
jgi:hypothetical protein